MTKLHIINFDFEDELTKDTSYPLHHALTKNTIYKEMQYLPLIYADPHDTVLCTQSPPNDYLAFLESQNFNIPKIVTIDQKLPNINIQCWGYTQSLFNYLSKQNIDFSFPNIAIVKQVNDKSFRYKNSENIERSLLFSTFKELSDHLKKHSNCNWILKSVISKAARGQRRFSNYPDEKITSFIDKELKERSCLYIEPSLQIIQEFSTQWHIEEKGSIKWIGTTILDSTPKGQYLSSEVGNIENKIEKSFYNTHLKHAKKILLKISSLGYFGYIGLDSIIYLKDRQHLLYPISDINCRMTMGLVALFTQKKYFLDKTIKLSLQSYRGNNESLLPSFLIEGMYKQKMPLNLSLDLIEN